MRFSGSCAWRQSSLSYVAQKIDGETTVRVIERSVRSQV